MSDNVELFMLKLYDPFCYVLFPYTNLYYENMSDTKILQAILDGQRVLKEELKRDIGNVKKDVLRVESKLDKNGKRLDRLGMDLAQLSDDAPTIEEFDNLEKRVTKLEHSKFVTS